MDGSSKSLVLTIQCCQKDSDERVKMDTDRIQHWLGNGAKPTDRVLRFLDEAGILKREARNNPNKAVPGKKAQERVEEIKAKAEAAATAEEEAKNAETVAEETPAEEVAPEASAEEAPAEEATPEAPAEETAAEAAR